MRKPISQSGRFWCGRDSNPAKDRNQPFDLSADALRVGALSSSRPGSDQAPAEFVLKGAMC